MARGHQEVGKVVEGLSYWALLAVCTLDKQPQGRPGRDREGGLKAKVTSAGRGANGNGKKGPW